MSSQSSSVARVDPFKLDVVTLSATPYYSVLSSRCCCHVLRPPSRPLQPPRWTLPRRLVPAESLDRSPLPHAPIVHRRGTLANQAACARAHAATAIVGRCPNPRLRNEQRAVATSRWLTAARRWP